MTRFLSILPAAAALALSLALVSAPARAASPTAPAVSVPAAPGAPASKLPIAVLDMPRVLHSSAAGRSADEQLGELRAKYQVEIAHSEKALRAENAELDRQHSILSAKAFEQKRQAFEDKLQKTQRLVQSRNTDLQAATHQAQGQILDAVLTIVTGIMRERHIELVIDRSQMVASVTNIEITNEVMAALNKALPSVKVTVPASHPEPADRTKKK